MNQSRCERVIQCLRIATAMMFVGGGAGIVACANLGIKFGTYLSLGLLAAGVVALVPLIFEQLVSVWFTTKRGRVSITGLMLLTTCAGAFFAIYRNSASLAIVLMVFAVTITAACLESRRQQTDNSSRDA